MRVTIEDLEALKELNDELEENHVETERSLHEEIGMGTRRGCVVVTDHDFQKQRTPASENSTRRSSLWKSLARIWNKPSFDSVNW